MLKRDVEIAFDQRKSLTEDLIASELTLTHFASGKGKQSDFYRETLQDFATAWVALKASRQPEDFMKDII